LTPIWT